MGEKSQTLKCIALLEEAQKLRGLLSTRAEAYSVLEQKMSMWKTFAEEYETEAKINKEAFRVAVAKYKRYQEALEQLKNLSDVHTEWVASICEEALEEK
jgi:uncharacterized membrane protein YgaE (UPF0421/DUF939 family)